MPVEYVSRIEGQYLVGRTRVSLDSLVYLFREGMSAESMVDSYPALTLEQVHGALAFYLGNQKEIDAYLFLVPQVKRQRAMHLFERQCLGNQKEIDAYLAEGQRIAESQHQQSRRTHAELIAKLQRARHASEIPG